MRAGQNNASKRGALVVLARVGVASAVHDAIFLAEGTGTSVPKRKTTPSPDVAFHHDMHGAIKTTKEH